MLLPDEQPWLIASQTWRQTQKILNRSSSINRRHPSTVCESMQMKHIEAQNASTHRPICFSSGALRNELAWTPPLQRDESGATSRTLRTSGTRASWAKHGEASKIKDLWGQGKNVLRECVQEQARIGKAALEGMLLTTPVVFQSRAFLLTSFVIFVVCFLWPFCQSSGISFTSLCSFSNFDFLLLKPSMLDVPFFWHPFSPPLALAFVLTSLSLQTLFFMRVLRDFLDVCWCIVTVLRVSGLEWMVSSCYYVNAVSVFVHVLCCKFFAEYLVLERLFPAFSKFCVVCPTLTCQLHQVLSCFWCDMRCVLASP